MEARLNYVLLGSFFVAALLALAGFIFWMGKYDRNLSQYREYYIYNKELPIGIRIETPVRYLGLPVGFVKNYRLDGDQVEIVIWVKKEIRLNKGSKVVVGSQGLTGGNFFALLQGGGEPFGDTQKAILGFKENWIEQAGEKAEKVMEQLEVSLERFNRLLSNENLNNIEISLNNFAGASGEFSGAIRDIRGEILQIGEMRKFFENSLREGDYNLKLILAPLLFDLERNSQKLGELLQNGNNVLRNLEESPSDFLFGYTKQKLGPRE